MRIIRAMVIGIFAALGFLVAGAVTVPAQVENCPYVQNPPFRRPLSPHIKQRMIELCIEDNKKDFEKMMRRTEKLARLTKEIETSFEENKRLSRSDKKKLKEAEKLLDKIRDELRADDDDDDAERRRRPRDVVEAVEMLSENTAKLVDELKKTTRHTISAVAIQSSGTVLKLVKWLRFRN